MMCKAMMIVALAAAGVVSTGCQSDTSPGAVTADTSGTMRDGSVNRVDGTVKPDNDQRTDWSNPRSPSPAAGSSYGSSSTYSNSNQTYPSRTSTATVNSNGSVSSSSSTDTGRAMGTNASSGTMDNSQRSTASGAYVQPNAATPAGAPKQPDAGYTGSQRYATNQSNPAPVPSQSSDTSSSSTPMTSSSANASDRTASAQTASERQGMGPVTPADKMFLVALSGSNRAEIAAAELALSKSNDPTVKQFAQQMITDHRAAEEKVQALGKSKNVDIDAEIPQDARSASYELGKLSGTNFDKQYFAVNHAAHMKAVAAVQHAAQNADDSDIRSLAQALLPTLKQHTMSAGQGAGHSMQDMNSNTNR